MPGNLRLDRGVVNPNNTCLPAVRCTVLARRSTGDGRCRRHAEASRVTRVAKVEPMKTKTVPYDMPEQLRTPEEMAAYLDAWLDEAPDDIAGIARALGGHRSGERHDSGRGGRRPEPRKPVPGAERGWQPELCDGHEGGTCAWIKLHAVAA